MCGDEGARGTGEARDGGGTQSDREDEGEHAEGADPAPVHESEFFFPRNARADAVGRIGEPVLVQPARERGTECDDEKCGDQGRSAEPKDEGVAGRDQDADDQAHQRERPRPVPETPEILGPGGKRQPREELPGKADILPPAANDTAGSVERTPVERHLGPLCDNLAQFRPRPRKKHTTGDPIFDYSSRANNPEPWGGLLVAQRSVRTLEDIRRLIRGLPGPDAGAAERAAEREPQLTKPPGALGRLEDLSVWLAAWQGRHPPGVERIGVRVFAGSHGVAVHGVSAYPPDVTGQMVANFEAGGAAVNQLSRSMGAELCVAAIEIARPTHDFTKTAAMSEDEFAEAFAIGMDSVAGSMDLLCLGEMGIGNTTAAAAVAHGLFGGEARDWTGAGTGLEGKAFVHKIGVVGKAVRLHKDSATDALDILRRLGGRELAAIAGATAAARLRRIPVVLDGYVSTAAAAAIEVFAPGSLDHCEVGHVSAEAGHRRLLQRLNKRPLLDLGMRLGEGTGAVLASAVIRAAAACHAGMATFAAAGVSDKPRD